MSELSKEQQQAMDSFIQGKNIFLTGPGGCGKSHLIRHFKMHAERNQKHIQVCAMTGTASALLQCKAKTIHAWGGIGMASGLITDIVKRVTQNPYKVKVWRTVDILILDEVSMLSKKIFEVIDTIARIAKNKRTLPFGGIQVVLSGDFYQLPPVGDEEDPGSREFCFESDRWKECMDHVHVLQTIFRQTDDAYKKILNQIRVGKISTNTITKLKQRVCPYDLENTPTLLYPTRARADTFNTVEYAKLTETEYQYDIEVVHQTETLNAQQKKIRMEWSTSQMEYETTQLVQSLMVVQSLKLKIGTRVMCVANIDPDQFTIVNGSQGLVIGVQGEFSYPLVKFHNGIIRLIVPHVWNSETIPGLTIRQIPLIYAWAITIHKAQGITLDTARIDAGSRIFECGQTYVALSRVRTLNHLYLCEFEPSNIRVNRKVKQFYEHLII